MKIDCLFRLISRSGFRSGTEQSAPLCGMILFLLILISLASGQTAVANSVGLGENWSIEHQGEIREIPFLKGAATKYIKTDKQFETVIYRKNFNFNSKGQTNPLSLILPPNWANLRISVNGTKIFDEISSGRTVARIFADRIIPLPEGLLAAQNEIVIETAGHPLFLGFRSSSAQLTDQRREVEIATIKNYFYNDSHALFIGLSVVIAIASFWMSTFAREKTGILRHLALTNLGIIPHHLLATDVYKQMVNSEDLPFKLQMLFQLVSWTTFLPLLADLSGKKVFGVDLIRKFSSRSPLFLCLCFGVSLSFLTLPFGIFAIVVYPVFALICAASLVFIMFMKKDAFGLFMMTGTFLCITSLMSDVVFGNLYLLGHGTALFSLVSVSIISSTFKASFLNGRAFAEIVRYSLPNSVHERIHGFLASGEPIGKIRECVSGNDLLSIVLVDICDWGKMNDVQISKIPPGLLRRSRNLAFARFEKVAEDFAFDLLKTTGDNMMFVGGLFKAESAKQVSLSNQTLLTVRALIDSIDGINAELRNHNLPGIKIKISATLGECEFGLEMYNKRLQFDVQGHPVNSAYRIEASIGEDFYRKFGRNIAVVSNSVIYPCEDLALRKRFPFMHNFSDKHGIEYECYVAPQYEEQLEVSDFAQALYGFYSHVNNKPSSSAPELARKDPTVHVDGAELRASPRKKLYLNDGFEVSLSRDGQSWQARALDLSESGLAIALSRESQFDPAQGETFDLTLKIESQDIALQAEVVSVSHLGSSDSSLRRFGLKFSSPLRKSTERQWRRFATAGAAVPTLRVQDAIDSRRSTLLRCVDVSAGGVGVCLDSSDILLIPGMRRKVQFAVPGEEPITIGAEVRYVRRENDNSIRAGFEVYENVEKMRELCGAYLVASERGKISFADVRSSGLSVLGIRRVVDVKYPSTEDEEKQIDSLRQLMLSESSLSDQSEVSVRDRFDLHSRQIICKVGDRVVAAVRVVFNDGREERIEHLSYGAEIPPFLFESGFVECSRLIVHPEFRGDEILWTLMAEIGRVTLTSGHRYILQSCAAELSPLYERFGFKPCGSFGDSGKTWILNILDIEAGIRGRTNNGVAWALVYSELNDIMQNRHNYRMDILDRARTTLLDKTRPIVMAKYRKVRSKYAKKRYSAAS